MALDSLKLNKQVASALMDAGISTPKEIQERAFSRIMGGGPVILIGPEGAGKTTTLVMAVLMRLKYAHEIAARALILVPNKEKGLELLEQFKILGRHTDLRTLGIFPGMGIEGLREDLAEGVDIIVGTPDRVQALYYKTALNMNRIQFYAIDDAQLHIKQGYQTILIQLANSIPKCQFVIASEVMHDKLEKLSSAFMINPGVIEVELDPAEILDTMDLMLYQVPNYRTKLNLLNMLMKETELFTKVVVIANTVTTADNIHKSLSRYFPGEVGRLKPTLAENLSFESVDEFKVSNCRILILSNQRDQQADVSKIPFIIHFDLPEQIELFIERILTKDETQPEGQLAVTFATDIELILVSKIEQAIGKKIEVEELPYDLVVEGNAGSKAESTEPAVKKQASEAPQTGEAFHEKKASNAKDYNLKYKDRLKMFGKKNRPNKKMK